MASLITYKDHSNMFFIKKSNHIYCFSGIFSLLANEIVYDNNKFIIVFTLFKELANDSFNKKIGIILDKQQQTEWVLNSIGTDDLFNIDNWHVVKTYDHGESCLHEYISLKPTSLEEIQQYKFHKNLYRE